MTDEEKARLFDLNLFKLVTFFFSNVPILIGSRFSPKAIGMVPFSFASFPFATDRHLPRIASALHVHSNGFFGGARGKLWWHAVGLTKGNEEDGCNRKIYNRNK